MRKINMNYLNGICVDFVGKSINKVYWKDGSLTDDVGLYLGVVNFRVAICKENSLWSEEIEKAKEIEFC